MNVIFSGPAVTVTSIVACRSFVSLSTFRQKGVYIHSAMPYSSGAGEGGGATRTRGNGGVTNDNRRAKKQRVMGKATAGSTLPSMAAGVDSMGQPYSMDVLDLEGASSTLEDDHENGQVVVCGEIGT